MSVADLMWFLTRASGIVALVLMIGALADGIIFSGREGGRRLRPDWWLDLHRGLGGYAIAFTGLHLVTAFGADIGAGLTEMFIPGASDTATTGFTLGVVALYGMAITVFTSWPRQLFRRRVWHALHLLSIPTAIAAGVHAWQLGTGLALVCVAIVMYPIGLRLSGIVRRRSGRGHSPTSPAVRVPPRPPLSSSPPLSPAPPMMPAAPPIAGDRVLVGPGD
jgi:methionine sulfoxide reductase heme-binding subunit